jgi:hypothetical protein
VGFDPGTATAFRLLPPPHTTRSAGFARFLTMSCSSRAMRSRSDVIACSVAWARSASACTWLCHTECPTSQTITVVSAAVSVVVPLVP